MSNRSMRIFNFDVSQHTSGIQLKFGIFYAKCFKLMSLMIKNLIDRLF